MLAFPKVIEPIPSGEVVVQARHSQVDREATEQH